MEEYTNEFERINRDITRADARRAAGALKIYEGKTVMLVLQIARGPVVHTCLGTLDVTPDRITVTRHKETWSQEISFDYREVETLEIEIGTFRPTIHATMPYEEADEEEEEKQGTGRGSGNAIVPSSSGA